MKIEFIPVERSADGLETMMEIPVPSSNAIPEWYKNMPQHIGIEKKDGLYRHNNHATNTTVKACSPFLDGLASGYTYSLQIDLEVRATADEHQLMFRSRTNESIVTKHDLIQHPGLPIPENAKFSNVFKWSFPFRIKTPKGYGVLFTHPLNRHDLPFRTFSGIVDTDVYTMPVQFPFQFIKELDRNDPYIIPKGTPIVQMIPIKRDSWERERGQYSLDSNRKNMLEYFSTISRSYKKNFWQRKEYK